MHVVFVLIVVGACEQLWFVLYSSPVLGFFFSPCSSVVVLRFFGTFVVLYIDFFPDHFCGGSKSYRPLCSGALLFVRPCDALVTTDLYITYAYIYTCVARDNASSIQYIRRIQSVAMATNVDVTNGPCLVFGGNPARAVIIRRRTSDSQSHRVSRVMLHLIGKPRLCFCFVVFISVRRTVISQPNERMNHTNVLSPPQSAYRLNHSTETVLLRIFNDLLTATDNKIRILTLLDLLVAFDTMGHQILLTRLRHSFGTSDSALPWFRLIFVTEHTQSQ